MIKPMAKSLDAPTAATRVVEETRSLCRICTAQCPILVGVDAKGRPVSARGDKSNPSSEGFFCSKGKHYPEMHTFEQRFRHSQRRNANGQLEAISAEQAMDEVAEKLQAIIAKHGRRSVAIYSGTLFYQLPPLAAFATAWMDALGLGMRFSSGTIDQPGKQTAAAAHGHWLGGSFPFDECDTWMLVGTNPLVSISGGIPHANPGRRLKRAQARGFDLIVIDPRKTETARYATLHIQPKPSTDPAVLAGIIHQVFEQELVDAAFVARHTTGVDELRRAVARFTPEHVEQIADVPAEQIVQAAALFAKAANSNDPTGRRRRGSCTAGTGANMSGWSNITEYLVLCLNTLCGKWRQNGDEVSNPGVLTTRREYRSEAIAPYPMDGFGKPLRIRGFTPAACGLPTSVLADEILLPGDGQVKALITIGGNPMMAWPDQQRTADALAALELNVVVEPRRTATADTADYVLAPKLPLETPGTTLSTENLNTVSPALGYTEQYAQYVPAIVETPAGSDLREDWEFFYGLAQRMGVDLQVKSGVFPIMGVAPQCTDVDMQTKPSSEDVLDMLCKGSWLPLDELRKACQSSAKGKTEKVLFSDIRACVQPARRGADARLSLNNQIMFAELASFGNGKCYEREGFPFTLISRRVANTFNSVGTDVDGLRDRFPGNPLYMHPDDMRSLGLNMHDKVTLRSAHGAIDALVQAEKTLRLGCLAMTHCWGTAPGEKGELHSVGSAIGRLISVEEDYAQFSGIPLMSGIKVAVERG